MDTTKEVATVPEGTEKEKYEKSMEVFRPNPAFATSLVPRNFDEAMKMAHALAKTNVVPKDVVGRPEACFVVLAFGMELGLPPMQALQNIMVVNGRPSIWGDAALALCMSSPYMAQFDEDAPDLALEQECGRCRVTTKDGRVVERKFSKADAVRAKLWTKEGPWQTYPGRMLQMRARSWALRDAMPQVLKGMQTREEVMDYIEAEQIHDKPLPVKMPERAIEGAKTSPDAIPGAKKPETAQAPTEGANAAETQPRVAEPASDAPDPTLKIDAVRRRQLFRLWSEHKIPIDAIKKQVKESFGIESTDELTNAQAADFEAWINEWPQG